MSGTASRITAVDLSAMVGSRLCHDLVSPLGAIGNGLELLQMSGEFPGIGKSPEVQLIAESVDAARARIQAFRMAFGAAPADQRVSLPDLTRLLDGMSRQGRVRITLEAEGDLPRIEGRMVLLAIMCFESAMPWGGRVLAVRAGQRWRLVADADRMKPDSVLWSWLSGDTGSLPLPAPSEVQFPLLAECAREAQRPLTWELDEKGGEISF
ncbi:MAG: histidine phosphotransferase family protein [Paracoccus sp. (in: a-proteobacteria)]|uniref:histidine phosphotransferase family protein n=1 Tax=Paracoccus sp. TaxID=267 RepID=UPI0026DFD960|nr:histidine phosphotransferase family protein [Paracoccus sp. (in: a-proteobacteria)]MDO5633222.1 histidine phosphotransferase family protein [Paracoccus sp. (in: a-proteobacteria)]